MQGSSKDLTASRMSRDRFLQGSLLKCSSSPGTCIPCKLGSRPVLMQRSCKAQRNLMRAQGSKKVIGRRGGMKMKMKMKMEMERELKVKNDMKSKVEKWCTLGTIG